MAKKSTKLAGYGKRMGTLLDRMAPHQADWDKLCQEITKAGFDPNELQRAVRAKRAKDAAAVARPADPYADAVS